MKLGYNYKQVIFMERLQKVIASSGYCSRRKAEELIEAGKVYVDGKKIGKSPIECENISRGKHVVKLVLNGYETKTKSYILGDKPIVINETLVSKVSTEVANPISKKEDYSNPAPVKATTVGTINGHAWVDLGLSVKWSMMNVGANSIGDYGDYFAWGEVRSKAEYTENYSMINKNISGNYRYDAARYHWGGSWRLPTKKEFIELKDKCIWAWVKQDGHLGYKVTGPNGNSIFLPASGYRVGTATGNVGTYGGYWSGSPHESDARLACGLGFTAGSRAVGMGTRYNGRSIRPVSD